VSYLLRWKRHWKGKDAKVQQSIRELARCRQRYMLLLIPC